MFTDLDLLRLFVIHRAFADFDGQDTVFKIGFNPLGVDILRQPEGPMKRPKPTF